MRLTITVDIDERYDTVSGCYNLRGDNEEYELTGAVLWRPGLKSFLNEIRADVKAHRQRGDRHTKTADAFHAAMRKHNNREKRQKLLGLIAAANSETTTTDRTGESNDLE